MSKYRSFDEVLKELDMDEDELKRLVSEGQIRAFRDEDRMKFRTEDVVNLRSSRTKEVSKDEIELGETQVGGSGLEVVEEETDETLLDLQNLSGDKDFEDTGATSVPTVELEGVGGEDQEATLTEELVFDETDELGGLDFEDKEKAPAVDADATQKIDGGLDLNEDDDVGLQTEPVEEIVEDEAPARAMAPMGAPAPVQIQEQIKYVEIVPNEGMAWKVLNGVTFILVMFLFVTFPLMGLFKSDDVLSQFWGGTAYSVYTKPKHDNLQGEPYRVDLTQPNAKDRPIGFSVGQKNAKHQLWPGQDMLRKASGHSINSAAGNVEGDSATTQPVNE
ncbi:MAG: hypothetical protein IT462_10365 [Planctomycetes bacterium]|nr:hypothetical protein [Planctomycetota bacterium]